MIIKAVKKQVLAQSLECVAVGVFEKTTQLMSSTEAVNTLFGGQISAIQKKKVFKGKSKETFVLSAGEKSPEWGLVFGLGDKDNLDVDTLRHAAAEVIKQAERLRCKKIVMIFDDFSEVAPEMAGQALAEGLEMGAYCFDHYRTQNQEDKHAVQEVVLVFESASFSKFEHGVSRGCVVGNAVNLARDLANMAPNDLTPQIFVDFAKGLFDKKSGVAIEIIDSKKAHALGMNAFLGVAQGSIEPPYMLVLKYLPQKGKKALGLIGKGVTFDTGGISIKPSAKMSEMKGDMSGAAAVLATMSAVAKLKPAQNVVAVMALTENMCSGNAQRPGDVVSAMNGKTIEIINTDAEGRLVLADALCYALTLNVKEMVDIATLTGACSVALGDVAAAILGNDETLINSFLAISEITGEKLWPLPLFDEYKEYMKSEVADLANASENRLGGTCYGAKFLEEFVNDVPWVHLDVASMMHYSTASGYRVKGMSGVGVLNLVAYCCGWK